MNDLNRDRASDGNRDPVLSETPGGRPDLRPTGRRWIVSVFGDITRSGSWPTTDHMSPIAVFGDIDLDFRNATMPARKVAIQAIAPFGNIEVLVPDGVPVDVGGFTLFGSKRIAVADTMANQSTDAIRVRGFTLFGSFKVRSSST